MTVDGTDCRIVEPSPFSTDWFSHKFRAAGLRYEIAVSIGKGEIVWANGPYPCGSHPDQKNFNLCLKQQLCMSEVVLADRGYGGPRCVYDLENDSRLCKTLLAKHETANRRIKHFKVLSDRFRHDLALHSYCFHAAVNLTELMIENSDPLFTVKF